MPNLAYCGWGSAGEPDGISVVKLVGFCSGCVEGIIPAMELHMECTGVKSQVESGVMVNSLTRRNPWKASVNAAASICRSRDVHVSLAE